MLKRRPTVLALSPIPQVKILSRELYDRSSPSDEPFQSNYRREAKGRADSSDDAIILFDNLHFIQHHHNDRFLPGNHFQWFKGTIEEQCPFHLLAKGRMSLEFAEYISTFNPNVKLFQSLAPTLLISIISPEDPVGLNCKVREENLLE